MAEEPTDYELQRLENIARNRQLLAGLGLEVPGSAGAGKRANSKKRAKPRAKKVKKEATSPSDAAANPRKSARVAELKKHRSYAEDQDDDDDGEYKRRKHKRKDDFSDSESDSDSEASMTGMASDSDDEGYGSRKRKRSYAGAILAGDGNGLRRRIVNGRNVQHIDRKKERHNPKVFGPIPGIEIGHWWPSRIACSADSVHPPTVGGIYGTGSVGAYSVAVSGGYEDDIDEGFRFTFTGSGGRDLKGTAKRPKNLRTAPQSSDQTLTGFNLALKTSCDTGKPVRVIRGYKAALGPDEGYRYDGLYTVLRAWQDIGLSGFKVWRFAFKRIDGQKPLDTTLGKPDDHEDFKGSETEESVNDSESERSEAESAKSTKSTEITEAAEDADATPKSALEDAIRIKELEVRPGVDVKPVVKVSEEAEEPAEEVESKGEKPPARRRSGRVRK